MLEREQILPNSGFETPNRRIPLEKWNLQVCKSEYVQESGTDRNIDSNKVLPLDSQERGSEGISEQVRFVLF